MDADMVVQILVGANDINPKLVGTGYPVAKDRILTARHLFDKKQSDEKIWVRWPTKDQEQVKSKVADFEWIDCAANGPDAAVLKTIFPAEVSAKALGLLSERCPQAHERWTSRGYGVSGGSQDGIPATVGMIGKIISEPSSDVPTFELGVDYETSLANGWNGLSGGSVFVGGEILGIIISRPKDFQNKRLFALSSWHLLQIDVFRKAVCLPPSDNYVRQHRAQLYKWLKSHLPLHRALEQVEGGSPIAQDVLADRMLKKSAGDFLMTMRRVCKKWEGSEWPDGISEKIICEIVFKTLPVLAEQDAVNALRQQQESGNVPIPAGVTTLAGAEMTVARLDQRAMKFNTSSDPRKLPIAAYAVPDAPAGDIENRGQQIKDHITKVLVDELGSPGASWTDQQTIGSIGNILKDFRDLDERRYYSFIPKEIGEEKDALHFVKDMNETYEALQLVPLGGGQDKVNAESTITTHLAHFAYLAAKESK